MITNTLRRTTQWQLHGNGEEKITQRNCVGVGEKTLRKLDCKTPKRKSWNKRHFECEKSLILRNVFGRMSSRIEHISMSLNSTTQWFYFIVAFVQGKKQPKKIPNSILFDLHQSFMQCLFWWNLFPWSESVQMMQLRLKNRLACISIWSLIQFHSNHIICRKLK